MLAPPCRSSGQHLSCRHRATVSATRRSRRNSAASAGPRPTGSGVSAEGRRDVPRTPASHRPSVDTSPPGRRRVRHRALGSGPSCAISVYFRFPATIWATSARTVHAGHGVAASRCSIDTASMSGQYGCGTSKDPRHHPVHDTDDPRRQPGGRCDLTGGSSNVLGHPERPEPSICAVARWPSGVIASNVPDVQPVEELPSCPFGPEHVKGRVLPMPRDDLAFALGL